MVKVQIKKKSEGEREVNVNKVVDFCFTLIKFKKNPLKLIK